MSLIFWPYHVSGSSVRNAAAFTLTASFWPALAAKKLARPLSPFSPTPWPFTENSTRCDMPSQTSDRQSSVAPAPGFARCFRRVAPPVDPPQAKLVAINAREVGLATDPRRHAAVQRVIPDVEFPHGRRIDGRNEVAHAVHGIDDELVGADAVK